MYTNFDCSTRRNTTTTTTTNTTNNDDNNSNNTNSKPNSDIMTCGVLADNCWKSTVAELTSAFLRILGHDCILYFLYSVHFVVPVGISPVGNSGRFPQEKPAAT